jgi:peptidoglycan/xylan/chitin deacetylase (PgdA/CDA1 family)
MHGIRIDKTLTRTVFHPLRRALGRHALRLPVLMYHRICDDPEPSVSPYYKVNTSPVIFRRHLRQLAELGCRTMDLASLAALLVRGEPLAPNSVAITFDDGFRDFYTQAFPVLQEHHFTATVFLPTAFIGEQRRSFHGSECLTWEEVRRLRHEGIEFGSHTVNHPKLVELSPPQVERELRESKDQIEQHLAEKITTFAYPYAFPQTDAPFARTLRDMLLQAGYTCCATTEIGRVKAGDDPFRLKRLPVNSLDDAPLFRAKLDGGYDWLASAQIMWKNLKAGIRPAARPHTPQTPPAVPSPLPSDGRGEGQGEVRVHGGTAHLTNRD